MSNIIKYLACFLITFFLVIEPYCIGCIYGLYGLYGIGCIYGLFSFFDRKNIKIIIINIIIKITMSPIFKL